MNARMQMVVANKSVTMKMVPSLARVDRALNCPTINAVVWVSNLIILSSSFTLDPIRTLFSSNHNYQKKL